MGTVKKSDIKKKKLKRYTKEKEENTDLFESLFIIIMIINLNRIDLLLLLFAIYVVWKEKAFCYFLKLSILLPTEKEASVFYLSAKTL